MESTSINKTLILQVESSSTYDEIVRTFGQNGGGVYRLLWLLEGKRRTIHRLLAQDPEGVLYIGKAEAFVDRVIELKKALLPSYKSQGHKVASLLSRLNTSEHGLGLFSHESLCFELFGSDSPREAELRQFDDYFSQYGELPPLNRSA